jgi:hypothetical protein
VVCNQQYQRHQQRQRQRQQQQRQPLGEISGNSMTGGMKASRRKSRWGCQQCDVSLCNQGSCWYIFHKLN